MQTTIHFFKSAKAGPAHYLKKENDTLRSIQRLAFTLLFPLLIVVSLVPQVDARSFRNLQKIEIDPSSLPNGSVPQSPALNTVVAQALAGEDLENILLGNQFNYQQVMAVSLSLGSKNSSASANSPLLSSASTKALLNARPKPSRQRVKQALEQVLSVWNTTGLQDYLGKDFYDGARLSQNLAQRIPQDATLKLLTLEGFQLLSDEIVSAQTASGTQELARAWLASADAVTQIEFNDPLAGFVQLRGKQRFTLRLFDLASGQLALQ